MNKLLLPSMPPALEQLLSLKQSKYFETYIRLADDRFIFINEDFSQDMAAVLSGWMLLYDHLDPTEEITLFINSVGGDASALTQIYDIMQIISAPVKTVCMGKCYSAGAILLACGSPGKRLVMEHSEVMIHGLQAVFPMAGDKQLDSESYMEFLERSNDMILKLLAKHTGHPLSKIKEDCKRDLFMDAAAAIKYGLADEIVGQISE
jgi:ATP-dependent Clp protease, protease subunit